TDLDAQGTNSVVYDLGLISAEQQQIAVLGAATLKQHTDGFIMQVLDDGRLQALAALGHVIDLDPSQALGAIDANKLGVVVDFATRDRSTAGHAQRHNPTTYLIGS